MIASYAQLLVSEYPVRGDNKIATYVRHIVDGTARMRELIVDLLTYTELRAPDHSPAEAVNLDGVVEAVKVNLQSSVDETNAVVTRGSGWRSASAWSKDTMVGSGSSPRLDGDRPFISRFRRISI